MELIENEHLLFGNRSTTRRYSNLFGFRGNENTEVVEGEENESMSWSVKKLGAFFENRISYNTNTSKPHRKSTSAVKAEKNYENLIEEVKNSRDRTSLGPMITRSNAKSIKTDNKRHSYCGSILNERYRKSLDSNKSDVKSKYKGSQKSYAFENTHQDKTQEDRRIEPFRKTKVKEIAQQLMCHENSSNYYTSHSNHTNQRKSLNEICEPNSIDAEKSENSPQKPSIWKNVHKFEALASKQINDSNEDKPTCTKNTAPKRRSMRLLKAGNDEKDLENCNNINVEMEIKQENKEELSAKIESKKGPHLQDARSHNTPKPAKITEHKKQKNTAVPSMKQHRRFSSLETIFEYPRDRLMSMKKYRRYINFDDFDSDIRLRRRRIKAMRLNPHFIVADFSNTTAAELILNKLS